MAEALWQWDELVAAAGGEADGRPESAVDGVSIDSRSVAPGDLFVALKDKRDGHEFVSGAFKAGAGAALVCRDYERQFGDGALLRVEDTLRALERIGGAARQRLPKEARVIAVTGSAGKTTTKEMLKAGLSRLGATHAADKSFNNHLGVPLTLSRMPRETMFGVFEIGMNHAGEIAPLAKMVRPHVALVMNVLAAHLGHFASTKEIAEEKAEIFKGLVAGGVAIYNADSAHADILRRGAEAAGGSVAAFGCGEDCDARPSIKGFTAGDQLGRQQVSVGFGGGEMVDCPLPVPGHHIAMNAAGALLAVREARGNVAKAAEGFSDLIAPEGRGARHLLNVSGLNASGGQFLLIDESYNANPGSMAAAIETAREAVGGDFKRLVLVLGDMLELGEHSARLHLGLKSEIEACRNVRVFTVGEHMAQLFDALEPGQQGAKGTIPADIEGDLIAAIQPGDVVMVKGSNGAKAWQLAEVVRRQFAC
ncbi:MAG: UDP-N-acetylmuramoyl-tripeptide--D-alanyl-D-alanine ligase [Alphaproteobacteria bacterium]|nr:UDP-N-acetylmuramoyl-tripeptide--D-alanyl-D-alanine ligase [Alphaproteobacteria bacterium]